MASPGRNSELIAARTRSRASLRRAKNARAKGASAGRWRRFGFGPAVATGEASFSRARARGGGGGAASGLQPSVGTKTPAAGEGSAGGDQKARALPTLAKSFLLLAMLLVLSLAQLRSFTTKSETWLTFCSLDHGATLQHTAHVGGKSLNPVHWDSSWVGRQWMPPAGYRLYSPMEMRSYFSNRSLLAVGDSTARRQFATWYATLESANASDISVESLDASEVIDVNKRAKTENVSRDGYALFRQMPRDRRSEGAETHHAGLHSQSCLSGLVDEKEREFLGRELDQLEYSVVLFILGPWEYSQKWECNGVGRWNTTVALLKQLKELSDLHPKTKFVWRSWAGPSAKGKTGEEARTTEWKSAQAHNHFMKALIHKFQREQYLAGGPGSAWNRISYVDWGMAMGPRLFPDDRRIMGDIPNHFGFEARFAFNQMLMNHLVELERQDALSLVPTPWVMDGGGSAGNGTSNGDAPPDDCSRAGLPPYYCLSREELASSYASFLTKTTPLNLTPNELAQIEKARADFCEECAYAKNINCGYRLVYMRGHYGLPELKALGSVMEAQPACNRTQASEA